MASYASLGDVIIAEPGAQLGFAGRFSGSLPLRTTRLPNGTSTPDNDDMVLAVEKIIVID